MRSKKFVLGEEVVGLVDVFQLLAAHLHQDVHDLGAILEFIEVLGALALSGKDPFEHIRAACGPCLVHDRTRERGQPARKNAWPDRDRCSPDLDLKAGRRQENSGVNRAAQKRLRARGIRLRA